MPDHELAFLIREDKHGDYYHILAEAIYLDKEGRVRNTSTLSDSFPELHKFRVYSQGNNDESPGKRRLYAWYPEFHEVNVARLQEANRMVRVLSRLERGMERLSQKAGRPTTFGQYLLRIATLLSVRHFMFIEVARANYDDCVFTKCTSQTGADRVDWLVKQWVGEEQPV